MNETDQAQLFRYCALNDLNMVITTAALVGLPGITSINLVGTGVQEYKL